MFVDRARRRAIRDRYSQACFSLLAVGFRCCSHDRLSEDGFGLGALNDAAKVNLDVYDHAAGQEDVDMLSVLTPNAQSLEVVGLNLLI